MTSSQPVAASKSSPKVGAFLRRRKRQPGASGASPVSPRSQPKSPSPARLVEITPPGSPAGMARPQEARRRSPSPHPVARHGVSFADGAVPSVGGLQSMAEEILMDDSGPESARRPGVLRGLNFINGGRHRKGKDKGKGKGMKSGKGKGGGKSRSKGNKGRPAVPDGQSDTSPAAKAAPSQDEGAAGAKQKAKKKGKKKKASSGGEGEDGGARVPSKSGSR